MSLSVANVPVVATALVRRFGLRDQTEDPTSFADESPDGPRFSSFRFKSRITGGRSTHGTFGFTTRQARARGLVSGGTTTDGSGSGTDTDLGLTSKGTLSAAYTLDEAQTRKDAHYISVGSLQGDSQWRPSLDPAARATMQKREGDHYISVGSVRVQEPLREVEEVDEEARVGGTGRAVPMRIGALWAGRQRQQAGPARGPR